jgi:hypothetical protein
MQWSKTPLTPCFVGTPVQEMLSSWLYSVLITHYTAIRAICRHAITRPPGSREGKLELGLRWTSRAGSPYAGYSGGGLAVLIRIVLKLGEVGMEI